MTENLGFEIREPTQDFPFTVIVRETGDDNLANQVKLSGRTLGGLPDLNKWGLELAVRERVEGPEHVVSTALYIVDPLFKKEEYPGQLPGVLLSGEWSLFFDDGVVDVEIRVEPGIDHETVDWVTMPATPEQLAFLRLKDKLFGIGQSRPELEIIARLPGINRITNFIIKNLEKRYHIRTCQECACFDEAEGKREYEKITHTFENGEMAMNKDIAQMVSQERRIRNLDETQIGLCTLRETLIERSFQACPEFQKARR